MDYAVLDMAAKTGGMLRGVFSMAQVSCLLCLIVTATIMWLYNARHDRCSRAIFIATMIACLVFLRTSFEWQRMWLSGEIWLPLVKDAMLGSLFAALFSLIAIGVVQLHLVVSRRAFARSMQDDGSCDKERWRASFFRRVLSMAPRRGEFALLLSLQRILGLLLVLELCLAALCCLS